jgi:hypothetical protein
MKRVRSFGNGNIPGTTLVQTNKRTCYEIAAIRAAIPEEGEELHHGAPLLSSGEKVAGLLE